MIARAVEVQVLGEAASLDKVREEVGGDGAGELVQAEINVDREQVGNLSGDQRRGQDTRERVVRAREGQETAGDGDVEQVGGEGASELVGREIDGDGRQIGDRVQGTKKGNRDGTGQSVVRQVNDDAIEDGMGLKTREEVRGDGSGQLVSRQQNVRLSRERVLEGSEKSGGDTTGELVLRQVHGEARQEGSGVGEEVGNGSGERVVGHVEDRAQGRQSSGERTNQRGVGEGDLSQRRQVGEERSPVGLVAVVASGVASSGVQQAHVIEMKVGSERRKTLEGIKDRGGTVQDHIRHANVGPEGRANVEAIGDDKVANVTSDGKLNTEDVETKTAKGIAERGVRHGREEVEDGGDSSNLRTSSPVTEKKK